MPLRVPPAPAPALRSVTAALRSRAADGRPALRPARALPVHELDQVRREGPPRTRLTGWRFLLCAADADAADGADRGHGTDAESGAAAAAAADAPAVGAAEAMLTADGWAFAHFGGGPYVASAERALRQAEVLPLPYQPRLLSVPELYMLTLWLHGDAEADAAAGSPGPSDLLVPLAPAPPGIAPHLPQRVDVLLPLLTDRLPAAPLLRASA
ncbi:hypothetical protein [Streptomyces sp. JJ36]|uniref:hypothetical protein n=1 Tax=Streptomyces sp. JJ36 TaxID=2736645 RepID=UPI001F39681E|nr:hypothetical protein [Streptomyces sp. JJ36]MCF6524325.1 hypothetical protein [Streptomyces sp. JJ36]